MIELPREMPLLAELSPKVRELLARTGRERRFVKGDRIVRKDHPAESAFILKEGLAEALIEKAGAESLQLSTIEPGEMFGELALFDNAPRTATVVAKSDCLVIEIQRADFIQEVTSDPETALKLLAVVSKRLRRAESVVSDYADRIYGDVLPRLQETVGAQLESAKTICTESRENAKATIERAESIQKNFDDNWRMFSRLGSILGAVVLVGSTALGIFGLQKLASLDETVNNVVDQEMVAVKKDNESSLEKIRRKVDDNVEKVDRAKNTIQSDIGKTKRDFENTLKAFESELRELDVLRETALHLDKIREDLYLDKVVDSSSAGLGEQALDFVSSYRDLMNEYIKDPKGKETEILIEALILVDGVATRGYVDLTPDWGFVINAVEYTLRKGTADWRERQRLRRVILSLSKQPGPMPTVRYNQLLSTLEKLLADQKVGSEQKYLVATTLIEMKPSEQGPAIRWLQQMANDEKDEKKLVIWRWAEAAAIVASLGDTSVWPSLRGKLAAQFVPDTDPNFEHARKWAFITALRLVEQAVKQNEFAKKYLNAEVLSRQLSAERFARESKAWLRDRPSGVGLLGYTLTDGMTTGLVNTSRFYQQYTCELTCRLGCLPGGPSARSWCGKCSKTLSDRFGISSSSECPGD